jgi:hypothetical protein
MTDREYFGELYPLYECGIVSRLVEIGKQRAAAARMRQNHQQLLEKNRLLKRKISEFK